MELVLSTARACLSLCVVVAVYLTSIDASSSVRFWLLLVHLYALHSLWVLLLHVREKTSSVFRSTVHGIDVLFPATLNLLTNRSDNHFFVFFFFPLLAAAYRWGFRQTLATVGLSILLLFIHVTLVDSSTGYRELFGRGPTDLDLGILAACLILLGVLLGYLAEREHQRRVDMSIVSHITGKLQAASDLTWMFRVVADELFALFDANRALIVTHETATGRVFLWQARRGFGAQKTTIQSSEVECAERDKYLFGSAAPVWHATRRQRPGHIDSFDVVAVDDSGIRFALPLNPVPERFIESHRCDSLLAVTFAYAGEWTGRLFLLDPHIGRDRKRWLRCAQMLVRELSPVIYRGSLLCSLRSRAGAIERARVARALHDGIIQSLIGAEMQVHVLRQQVADQSSPAGKELSAIQAILHEEVLNLRELMQRMKPIDLEPEQLPGALDDIVDRFQHETSIPVSFVSELHDVRLPPRTCGEIARIVQEALSNVRKHSGARHVQISCAKDNGHWKLVIEDDGRGFGFAGRLSQRELHKAGQAHASDGARSLWRAPTVIRESVRAIAGELSLESFPGRGARLEITFPQSPTRERPAESFVSPVIVARNETFKRTLRLAKATVARAGFPV